MKGGSVEMCKRMLKEGISVKAKDSEGKDSLFTAVEKDNLEVVDHLLSLEETDVNCQDNEGEHETHFLMWTSF